MNIEIVTIGDTPVPQYATELSAGLDLINAGDEVDIPPGCLVRLPTGIKMRIPPGYTGLLTPRSGKSFKSVGFSVANSPGVIDADYSDELGILACNYGNEPVHIGKGERISQLLIVPVMHFMIKHVEELSPVKSSRVGGFGSTGQ